MMLVYAISVYSRSYRLNTYADGLTLAWEEDFDFLDREVWVNEVGIVRNNEIQYYTDSSQNTYCQDGFLHLKAIKDDDGNWTSGSITSEKGFSFGYGLIEAKVKYLPTEGCWPAIWSMGDNHSNWLGHGYGLAYPKCGEIDWIEYLFGNTYKGLCYWYNELECTIDGKRTEESGIAFDDKWHIVGLERKNDEIRFYYDRKLAGSIQREDFQDELFPHIMS